MIDEDVPIKGYENEYTINRSGVIYSIRNHIILKQYANEKGYMKVCLQKNGRKKWYRVHRLVANTFIPNPQCKPTVNHINGRRDDNRVENLEWATMKEQSTKEANIKRSASLRKSKRVKAVARGVLVYSLGGQFVAKFDSIHEAARQMGTTAQQIWSCCNGKIRSLHGKKYVYSDGMALPNALYVLEGIAEVGTDEAHKIN